MVLFFGGSVSVLPACILVFRCPCFAGSVFMVISDDFVDGVCFCRGVAGAGCGGAQKAARAGWWT